MANLKNDDGTVNFEGMKNHLNHLKGKYAQNAKNYEQNTGKKMNFATSEEEQNEPAKVEPKDPSEPRAEGGDVPDATQHSERMND